MATPSEVDVLRREVAQLLHEKINAYIEPTSLDRYTLGTDLATVEDMYKAISCLRTHVLEVDARANERIEENAQQLATDYKLFNELVFQAKSTISILTAQKTEAEAREAAACTLESALLSRLLSTEAQLTARAEIAEALRNAYREQFTKVTEMYTTLLESFQATKKKLARLSHENILLRQDNQCLTNELAILYADRDAAHERARNTLSMYGELGEKLSGLVDQCLIYYNNDAFTAPDIATILQDINNNVKELRREIAVITPDLQCTITDQETIITALTKELDDLQAKDLEEKIDIAKLNFLETENIKLAKELASVRYSSESSRSFHMKADITDASTQTTERLEAQPITEDCNANDTTL